MSHLTVLAIEMSHNSWFEHFSVCRFVLTKQKKNLDLLSFAPKQLGSVKTSDEKGYINVIDNKLDKI